MTTIDDIVYYADGSKANGQVLVSWPLFQYNGTAVVAGQETFPIVDGQLLITLYSNITALPTGTYYTANFELEEGAREEEYWIVPNLPVVTLSQCRATFPPAPGLLINALQLSGGGAQPGQFLGWNGSQWVPMYVTTLNVSPNTIGLNVTAVANPDISVSGTPATLGTSLTLNIPDAGSASRGAVTAGAQSIGGVKTFLSQVNFTTVAQYSVYAGTSSVWGATYFGTANKFHLWGSVILSTPDSSLATIQADGALLKHVDLSGGAVGTVALPGGAVTIPGMESILLPVGPNYAHGLGVDGAGNLWLGTASPTASFAYLRPDQAWVANWVDLSPYQHPSLPNTEVTPNAASIVLYKDATQWAGIGYDQNMRMWFRLGPNASGTYYYLGANQVSFANANYYVNSVLIGHRAGVNLIASSNVTLSGGDNSSNNRVDVVIAASGSLVDPTTTLGDFIVRGSAALNRLGVGSDGEVLTADSSQTLGVRWAVAGAATGGVPSTRQVIAGPGLYGGGELTADVTLGANVQSVFGRTGNIVLTGPDITAAGGVLQTRKILTGIGLTGGGDLSADRTLIGVAMAASGASHAMGMVPDPGATAGVTHYLREDATWVVPPLGLADPTTSVGDLIVRGSPVITRLAVGSNGQVLTADSAQALGVKWAAVAAGFVSPLSTKGDIMVYDTATTRLPVGSNGQVLTADSTQTPGLRWGAASTSFWVGGTGGAIYYNGGNVGIGTTSPVGRFEVQGTTYGNPATSGSAQDGSVRIGSAGHGEVLDIGVGGFVIWLQPRSGISTYATNYNLALNPNGGNVGVGLANPSSLLHVYGNVVPQVRIQNANSANNNVQLRFWGANAATDLWAVGTDEAAGSGSTDFHFHNLTNVTMTLQRAGNVGIGTTAPAQLLTVISVGTPATVATANQIAIGESSNNPLFRLNLGFAYLASVWTSVIQANNGGATGPLMLNPAGGTVGIGTTAVTGGDLFQVAASAVLGVYVGDPARVWMGSRGNYRLELGANGATGMAILPGGNVGIGTTNPDTLLTIDGSAPIVEIRNGGFLQIRPTGNTFDMRLQAVSQRMDILSGGALGAPLASFVQGGYVGINCTTPAAVFTVIPLTNPSTLAGSNQIVIGEASNNLSYRLNLGYGVVASANWAGVIQTIVGGSPGPLLLNPSGGNVGIGSGTTSPPYALHVVGNINCTSGYLVNGTALTGSGQPQTPWAQNINAQNFSLTSGGTFAMVTLNATNISAATGIAIGPVAVPSGIQMTVDYAVKSATPSWTVGSDMRTKQNVHELEGGLDVIRRLPPILVAEYNGLAHTPKDLRVVSFDLEKLREVLPYTVGSHRTKLREEDAEETDILHYNIHEVVMHLILAVKQLAEKN